MRLLFVLCAGFGLGALGCALQYVLIRRGRFRRNPFLGISNDVTRQSEVSWQRAHTAAAPWIARAGTAAAVASIIAASGFLAGSDGAAIPFELASGVVGAGAAGLFLVGAEGAARRAATSSSETEQRYPCPCCGALAFGEPPGSFEICEVCGWGDDVVQLRYPSLAGGANRESLIDAQIAYRDHRVAVGGDVLPPGLRDVACDRDSGWRVIDLHRDHFEIPFSTTSMPADRTRLYWWRRKFWRRSASDEV